MRLIFTISKKIENKTEQKNTMKWISDCLKTAHKKWQFRANEMDNNWNMRLETDFAFHSYISRSFVAALFLNQFDYWFCAAQTNFNFKFMTLIERKHPHIFSGHIPLKAKHCRERFLSSSRRWIVSRSCGIRNSFAFLFEDFVKALNTHTHTRTLLQAL